MKRIDVILGSCLFLAVVIAATGQVPERINYQGRLIDGTNLVNGSAQIVFRMFDAETGGTGQYAETHPFGVWYNPGTLRWTIFHEDSVAMPEARAFNVMVINP